MDRDWIYLTNPIDSATKDSNILGIRISKWHDGALSDASANPFIAALYASYHPVNVLYIGKFDAHKAKELSQKTATQTFEGNLVTLGFEKINLWDAQIGSVYPKGSPRYNEMLGNGHEPFQKGTQEERISAVSTLIINIGADVALAATKNDVQNFLDDVLNPNYAKQKAAINATGVASTELENARMAMCQEQYANLGAMMKEYKTNPSQAKVYFDLRSIRRGKQVFFQNHANKNSKKFIVKRTMDANAQLILSNLADTVLRFYLSDKKTGNIGVTFVELQPGEEKTIVASELGDVVNETYLMVFNPDTINKGEFTVEFI